MVSIDDPWYIWGTRKNFWKPFEALQHQDPNQNDNLAFEVGDLVKQTPLTQNRGENERTKAKGYLGFSKLKEIPQLSFTFPKFFGNRK